MSQVYEVTIHGSGFEARIDDGTVLRGFYATRRVQAGDPFEANARAIAAIQGEVEADSRFGRPEAQPTGASLHVRECYPVGWFMRWMTKAPRDFECYEE